MFRRLCLCAALLTAAACGDDSVSNGTGIPGLIGSIDAADASDAINVDVSTAPLDIGVGGAGDTSADAPADAATDATADRDVEDGSAQLCLPGAQLCDGDVLVTCSDDGTAVGRLRCNANGGRCVELGDGVARCDYDEATCTPGDAVCNDDLTASRRCADDGTYGQAQVCGAGCNPRTGLCNPAPVTCPDADVVDLAPGNYLFDLCSAGDRYQATPDGGACGDFGLEGPERVFRIQLDGPTDVLIDLRDEDSNVAIDTQLYVRTTCDDPDAQIACSDDIDCADSDVAIGACTGDVQRRQSRISARFDAGEYFVYADSLVYDDGAPFECGEVLLRFSVE